MILALRSSAAMVLALLAATPVLAQDAQQNSQQNSTVGSPQLRDFSLPGQRTTPPPAPDPEPVPTIPPTAEQPRPTPAPSPAPTPAAPVREQPRAAPAPRPAPERERAVREPVTQAAPAPAPNEAPAAPVPAPAPVLPQSDVPAPPPPAAPADRIVPEPLPAAPEGGFPWLALLLVGGLGLLGFLGYRRFAGGRDKAYAAPAPEPVAPPEPAPAPPARPRAAPVAASPAPAAPANIGIKLRPQLELEFKPDKAAATLTDANVQFELKVRNSGNMAARNIRIEARMFNAGAEQDREIGAFFARAAEQASSSTLPAIPPRGEVSFKSTVTMPKDAVREINVQGRRLFIPMVAFNVFYDWAEGKTGQTSMSYIVGREAPTPSEKMGAFRLDLGPRVYRSVGQRQTTLARVV